VNQQQLKLADSLAAAENLKFMPLERMPLTHDTHDGGEVLGRGSVWLLPSGPFRTPN
jgi:hypothetical protein